MTEKAFDKAHDPLSTDLARLYAERNALTGGSPDGPTEAMTETEATEQWERADNAPRRALLTEALGVTSSASIRQHVPGSADSPAHVTASSPLHFLPPRPNPGEAGTAVSKTAG